MTDRHETVSPVTGSLEGALVATLEELDRLRQAAWEGWEVSRRIRETAERAADEEGGTRKKCSLTGESSFLRMVLTCLDRRCQLLNLKQLVRKEPEIVDRVLGRLGSGGSPVTDEVSKPMTCPPAAVESVETPSVEHEMPGDSKESEPQLGMTRSEQAHGISDKPADSDSRPEPQPGLDFPSSALPGVVAGSRSTSTPRRLKRKERRRQSRQPAQVMVPPGQNLLASVGQRRK